MGHDSTEVRLINNGVNVPLAWAMFGGSTFVLFLLCYFCQKKLQDEDMPVMDRGIAQQVYVIPTINQQPLQNVPPLPSPPPDYNSVVKKGPVFQFDSDPPSYDIAIACLSEDPKVKPCAISITS